MQSWYLDLTMIEKYWGEERVYHHTAPISMNYALLEALRLVHEEGLEARFARHERQPRGPGAGLEALGLELAAAGGPAAVDAEQRRAFRTASTMPAVRKALLEEFGIEIGGGLGPLKGQVWRIGLMGESSTPANVLLVLST